MTGIQSGHRQRADSDQRVLELFDSFGDRIYNDFRWTRMLDSGLPHELTSEVYVRICRQAVEGTIPADAGLSWLRGIAKFVFLEFMRDITGEQDRQIRIAAQPQPRSSDPAEDVATKLDRDLAYRELHAALEALPEPLRKVIDLRIWKELTEEQTAEELGIRKGTVKSRFSRAKEQLKKSQGAIRAIQILTELEMGGDV